MARPVYLALVTALVTTVEPTGSQPESTHSFLRSVLGYSTSNLRELGQGKAVVRSLDTADGREVATVGAVRVAVSPEEYIAELRDIVEFKKHEAVVQIGTFGTPARPQDASGLTLDRDHIYDLRGCRLHHCDVQLSQAAIERMRAIDWSATDAPAQAGRMMRELLADVTAQYQQQGDAALMTYAHRRQPLSVAKEFRAMIATPPSVLQRFPSLERHVTQFPSGRVAGIDDVFYWSKEDIGPKVIISVTHMAFASQSSGPVTHAVASKQLYGSHYFDSSLGLTLLLRDEQPGSTVLVYLNRSRVDVLDGLLGGLKRAIVRSRTRAGMGDSLERIRAGLPARVRNR